MMLKQTDTVLYRSWSLDKHTVSLTPVLFFSILPPLHTVHWLKSRDVNLSALLHCSHISNHKQHIQFLGQSRSLHTDTHGRHKQNHMQLNIGLLYILIKLKGEGLCTWQPCGRALKPESPCHVTHVCVFPAGTLHDGTLKGSLQRSNGGINIIEATTKAEEGRRHDLHSSYWQAKTVLGRITVGLVV